MSFERAKITIAISIRMSKLCVSDASWNRTTSYTMENIERVWTSKDTMSCRRS